MRYFIFFGYDGTNYHGWQIQPNANSVQQELQHALSTLLRGNVEVVGAGRTDTGVHARRMAAHFDWTNTTDEDATPTNGKLPMPLDQLVYRLNRILPRDIAVYEVKEVDSEMHARFSATSRTYHYYIHTRKDPFERHYSLQMHYPLDFDKMNEAAEHFLHHDDYAAFCKAGGDNKTTICHVTTAKWVQTSPTTWYFEITANRFLRNMVRAVVGTLIDVGRGRITMEQFLDILHNGTRSDAGESMPGNALFLEKVDYNLE
nr:tRNA pseudouridine(38-40) synthase TruA [uncultured Prevotella sp.]